MTFPLETEPLLSPKSPSDLKKDKKKKMGSWSNTKLFLVFVASIVFLSTAMKRSRKAFKRDKLSQQQPTLLSVVDPDTMEYLRVRHQYAKYDEFLSCFARNETTVDLLPLHLDKTKIHNIRESLTVSWHSILHHGVRDEDLLALHCGDDAVKTMDVATIAQARATSQRNSPADATNQHEWYIPSFPITRESYCWFTLYSSNNKQAMAKSPILKLFTDEKPTNIHVALGNDVSKLIIHFTTGKDGVPVAMYGIGTPNTKVEGTSLTFEASDMCAAPANQTDTGKFIAPGMLHTIELTDLQPNTTYTYKVGLTFGQGVVWSDTFIFVSPRAIGPIDEPYTYIVYGDQGCPSVGWGQGGEWTAAMTARESEAREVHHFGDLSYARGAAHIWDEWLEMVSSFATRMPLMIALGNHEYDHTVGGDHGKDPSGVTSSHGFMPLWGNMGDDSGGECGVATSKRFRMPSSSPGSNGVFWYSFDSANVHTIVLSSEHDLSPNSIQYQWLEADLASVDRALTPWVVVELHRPLYFNEALWPDVAVGISMRVEFEKLLGWYKVDLVLAGHVHSYFRSCPGLLHSRCYNGGPTHIVAGAAGAVLDNAPTYANAWAVKNIQGTYGYGRITVHNETWMHFEFIRAGADDDKHAGDVLDEVWITHAQDIF
jgi:hypothetical protein